MMTPDEIDEAKLWAGQARAILRLAPDRYAVLAHREPIFIGSWPECEAYVLTGEALWDEAVDQYEWGNAKVTAGLMEALGLTTTPPVLGIKRRA